VYSNTAKEIASAMIFLHKENILHGDLSGGNVLLVSSDKDQERGWYAKVGDFGLSRVLTAEAISTGTYGTVTHMPPELLTTGLA
jgi:serine/threonine protein kinase